jgi:hypothetical protein
MKINVLVVASLMSVFAVSCAHNKIEEDTTKSVQEIPPKFSKEEVKKDDVSKKEVKSNTDLSLSCTQGKDSRIITIQKGDNRCEVHYTKEGQLNQVAWGEKTPSKCSDVFENVRTNLEKGNFKCVSSEKTAGL